MKYQRHFPGVKYADLLLPGRWPAYRISEGNHYIARAGTLLQQGEVNAALHQLRVGLAKAPANARGRTTLAELYVACRRPDLARELLLDGLRHLPDDRAYLQTTMSFLLEFQEDAKLLEVADRLLAAPDKSASHPLAASFAAAAAYYRGNYDRAEDLVLQHHLDHTGDGAVLLARMEGDRGYPELALLRLKEFLARQPHDGAYTLLAGYYRALGRTGELESSIIERLVSDPLAPAPRIEYLRLHHQRGDRVRLERDTGAFLDQFRHDSAALLLLADFAANTGDPALARRVQRVFIDRGDRNGAPALLVAEAHLAAGEYATALGLVAECTRDYPEWAARFASVCNGLQAVALCGLGKEDEARLHLDHLLAQQNLRAEHLVAVSDRLAALGASDLALSVLGRAVEADPLNQAALTNLLRLELDTDRLAALPAHLERYLRTRQPSREILARAAAALGSDRHLFLPAQNRVLASLRTALAPGRP
ncbi:MAG: tetratricopeptide repeat protein [Opitutae bacterium]|nr:tetratricopeptide repeat protein [Opitutae bacterium]